MTDDDSSDGGGDATSRVKTRATATKSLLINLCDPVVADFATDNDVADRMCRGESQEIGMTTLSAEETTAAVLPPAGYFLLTMPPDTLPPRFNVAQHRLTALWKVHGLEVVSGGNGAGAVPGGSGAGEGEFYLAQYAGEAHLRLLERKLLLDWSPSVERNIDGAAKAKA